jgi:chromosome segregation ATPase
MRRAVAITTVALLLLAGAPAWSASKSVDQAEKVAQGLLKLDETVKSFQVQLDKVTTTLGTLTAGQGDLKKSYESFAKESKKMRSMFDSAKKSATQAAKKREDYLKAWQENQNKIQNEQLKAAAEARRAQLLPIIEKIAAAGGVVRDKFAPYVADLNDIETYLGNDLTPNGLATVQPMATKCTGDANTLKSALDDLSAGIQELAGQIGPGGAK